MANHKPNYSGLLKHSKNKSKNVLNKVDDTIKRMIKNQLNINFNTVSLESGVSKAFLYKNMELRNRIDMLRQQQEGLSSPKQVKRNMSDASKDVIIASLRNRISNLEKENKQLKEQLKINFGQLYDEIQ
ncbi:transposase [Paenibacillus peoriae]|uniref:DUF6262 family protein n=1 Tax=Paenibacillus peoriae TaxID=59893 RepID=UPI000CEB9322|nr:DUF6262 family protein [Paenibacillus peoriae]PPQ47523.1 transposase [Paenibacillus peoriae]